MNDLIEENKAMLEYAKVSGVEFIDVLRKNIAAMELQKSGVTVSREIALRAQACFGLEADKHRMGTDENEWDDYYDEVETALSAKESEL